MSTIQVGQLYAEGRTSWPEGVHWNWEHTCNELCLFFSSPNEQEIMAVRKGQAEFGLVVSQDIIFLLFRFVRVPGMHYGVGWSDAPYTYHRLSEERKGLPPEEIGPETRSLLRITLIDASTGITRVIRGVSLSPAFTREMYQAIRAQAERPFNALQYDLQLGGIYLKNDAKKLYARSTIRCTGGE